MARRHGAAYSEKGRGRTLGGRRQADSLECNFPTITSVESRVLKPPPKDGAISISYERLTFMRRILEGPGSPLRPGRLATWRSTQDAQCEGLRHDDQERVAHHGSRKTAGRMSVVGAEG